MLLPLAYLRSAARSTTSAYSLRTIRGLATRCCDSDNTAGSIHSDRPRSLSSSSSNPFHDDVALDKLFVANKAWRDRINKEDPNFFPTLAKGQSPDFLYIGCADSRVNVTSLTGLHLGDCFIHRNIANMVVSSDMNLLAVLTYAVEYLKVKHILVTGHYDCGGVRAATQKEVKGQVLDSWLQNIRDVYRLHKQELDEIQDDEARHRRLVELNVVEQCLNLLKTSQVQQSRLRTSKDPACPFAYPRIHGLVFDPATGELSKIPINFRHEISELRDLYDLYDIGEYEKQDSEHHVNKKET